MPAKNNILTGIIKKIIFATNIAMIILLLASHLAWYISPLKTNLFSYIGLAFGFILFMNIAYLLFWILFRKWKPALISIIVLFICYKPILTFFPIHFNAGTKPGDSIQILTYNVQALIDERSKDSKKTPLLDYIVEADADIVCLQEYLVSKTGQSIKTQQDINRILNKYPYKSIIPLKFSDRYQNYGLACFSKYPIKNSETIKFKSSFNGAAIHTININGKKLAVANIHLESNRITVEDKKLYEKFLLNNEDIKLEDVTTNIRKRMGRAYNKRVSQTKQIKQALNNQQYDAAIICGDFNDTPISHAYATLKKGMVDAFVNNGFGPGITYHENLFWFRIDHIFHTPNIRSYDTRIDKVKHSDHYPLRTFFTIEKHQ